MTTLSGANGRVAPGRHTSILRHGEQVDAIGHLGSSANQIPTSYAKLGRTVQVHYCTGEIAGLREVDSLGSIVQVRAGPWSERDTLKKTASFFTYALAVGPKAYFGSAAHDRTIGDRLGKESGQVDQIYIVYSPLPCFDRAMADKVEGRLIEFAVEIGVPVLNKSLPFGRDGLAVNPGFDELMIDVRLMLAAAGFGHFDRHEHRTKRSRLSPANTIINNVRYIEPEEWVVPEGAQPVRLTHRDLQAEAFMTGPRRIQVAPGADWVLTSKSGLSTDNRRRREDIETAGKIERTGEGNRARLRIGLECTPAIAAKLLSGEHIDSDVWQPVVVPAATVQSDGQSMDVSKGG